MDTQQQDIFDDLSGVFRGQLRFDVLSTSIYATDASLYQERPLGVVYPVDADDVVALARYAQDQHIPLVPRGAGTGVVGAAVGRGLIVDFSRHLREIEAIGSETVRVQPGVVRNRLNERLRSEGRYFPPDPSNSATTTIGGMLAVDAAGSHAVRVGSVRDHVRSMEVVLPGGIRFEARSEPLRSGSAGFVPDVVPPGLEPGTTKNDLVRERITSRLAKLLADNEPLIRDRQPALIRNCCGYLLRGVLTSTELHLPRLLIGSEGTLGLFTSATLHTSPLPAHRGVVLLLFGNLESAISAVQTIAEQLPSACDLLDRRLLSLGRESDPQFEQWIPKTAEAALIVEQTGYSERQVRDRIRMVIESVRMLEQSVMVAREAYTAADVDFLWSLPNRVVPLLTSLPGSIRPLPFVEDIAVPPATLGEFLHRAQRVLQRHEVTASLYAHAASGQVHLRPFLPPPSVVDADRIESIARDLYDVVFSVGGTISGEHGDGLARTAFIRSQYGPLYQVFQQVKDIFDPHNLLNPGKIISDDPHVTIRRFRPVRSSSAPEVTPLQLRWDSEELTQAAMRCNGCGVCRSQEPGLRMCPFFRIDAVEEASPRSKANVMRNVMSGALDRQSLGSDDMKRLADLCFNCKQCQLECPSHVNIPQMMIEAKASYVAANGLSRADWILSRAHSFGWLGCKLAPVSNWILNSRLCRWVMERTLGIADQRKLPPFARHSFLDSCPEPGEKAGLSAGEYGQKPIVYFVDHYANYHDTELAQAFLRVLAHNRIDVIIPARQTASGMAMITAGDLVAARQLADANLRELCELVREGHQIVCTEPAAAFCLSQEYPLLIDHPDVKLLSSRVVEAGQFLRNLHAAGRLRTDFSPVQVVAGYHTPCHLRALEASTPFADLLSLIPGLTLRRIEKGCSGMAGAFGLTQAHFETSLQIGAGLIEEMQSPDILLGITECSSCKIQMEQGTVVPTIHPLKLLALAYGLMPELKRRLQPGTKRLLVT